MKQFRAYGVASKSYNTPDVYIRGFKDVPELTLRDSCAPNGGHHLIIWKESC